MYTNAEQFLTNLMIWKHWYIAENPSDIVINEALQESKSTLLSTSLLNIFLDIPIILTLMTIVTIALSEVYIYLPLEMFKR